jgi:V8-like Glu-specific endopeptidase
MAPFAGLAAVVLLIVGLIGSGGPSGRSDPATTPTAVDFDGTPTVGALFPSARATQHSCTATVVDSPRGDLLITAAHCIQGSAEGYVFAPEYHDGLEPLGAWTVTAAFGAPDWMTDQSPLSDVAFLVVAPQERHGHLEEIQAVTGGDPLGVTPSSAQTVSVPAYALGSDDSPFTCNAVIYDTGVYPGFDCNSYPGGTSGSPFLLATSVGDTVVGVIGGLHQGGCQAVTSYTTPFGPIVWSAYARAVAGEHPDSFPRPGGDGC